MTNALSFEPFFGTSRVMVILRGCPPDDAVAAAERAWNANVRVVEVPLGTEAQLEALAAVVDAGRHRGMAVGAGTVITPELANDAARVGARYTVAPGFDPTVLSASLQLGMPHLPGVMTPTEVQLAYRAACRWVKVFPAATLGPSWIRAIRGPFPDVNPVATGGITPDTAPAFLAAGARIVAFGAAITTRPDALARLVADTT